MTIDKAIPKLQFVRNALNDDMEIAKAYDMAIDTMRKYQQLQADYETRLKADMVAMLEEFDLRLSEYEDADLIRVEYVRQDIQEKINALKGDEDG